MEKHLLASGENSGLESLRTVQQNSSNTFDTDLFQDDETDEFPLSRFKTIDDSGISTWDFAELDDVVEDTLKNYNDEDGIADEILSDLSGSDFEEETIRGLKDPSTLLIELQASRLSRTERGVKHDAKQNKLWDPSVIGGGSIDGQQSTVDTIIEREIPTQDDLKIHPMHDADTSEDHYFCEEGMVDKITEEERLDRIADVDSSEVKQWDSQALFDIDTTEQRHLFDNQKMCDQTTSEDRRATNLDLVDCPTTVDPTFDPSELIDGDSSGHIMHDYDTTQDEDEANFDLVDKDTSQAWEF